MSILTTSLLCMAISLASSISIRSTSNKNNQIFNLYWKNHHTKTIQFDKQNKYVSGIAFTYLVNANLNLNKEISVRQGPGERCETTLQCDEPYTCLDGSFQNECSSTDTVCGCAFICSTSSQCASSGFCGAINNGKNICLSCSLIEDDSVIPVDSDDCKNLHLGDSCTPADTCRSGLFCYGLTGATTCSDADTQCRCVPSCNGPGVCSEIAFCGSINNGDPTCFLCNATLPVPFGGDNTCDNLEASPSISSVPDESPSSSFPSVSPFPSASQSSIILSTSMSPSVCESPIFPSAIESPSTSPSAALFGASLPPTSPSPSEEESNNNPCFPSDAKVTLRDGSKLSMSKLKIGDEVLVGAKEYSKVFMFTHQDPSVTNARYMKLTTETGKVLTATIGHFIYGCEVVSGNSCDLHPITIENVKVGYLVSAVGSDERLNFSRVISNYAVKGEGIFNPQTVHGDIVVDGVRCTTYTHTVYYKTAHSLLAPLRALYVVSAWIFALANQVEFTMVKPLSFIK